MVGISPGVCCTRANLRGCHMAQVIDNGTATVNGDGSTAEKTRFYVVVTMPEELKSLVDAWADENDVSAAELGRRLFASELGFDLGSVPAIRRKSKHATELDKIVAHMIASYKSSRVRSLLVKQHTARLAGKTADVQKLDELLAPMSPADWRPDDKIMAEIRTKAEKKIGAKS